MAAIAVLAKPAVPGRVKTRLARAIGAKEAARFADAFLRDTWFMLCSIPDVQPILASEGGARAPSLGIEFEVVDQGLGSLGDRMERVATDLLRRHPHVLLLGSDTPHLPSGHVVALLNQLKRVDVCLGPAEDGGFWGLAMRQCPSGCLQGVEWSVGSTARQTLETLGRSGVSIGIGPAWYDVDEKSDLVRMLGTCGRDALPTTREVARQLREVMDGTQ